MKINVREYRRAIIKEQSRTIGNIMYTRRRKKDIVLPQPQ